MVDGRGFNMTAQFNRVTCSELCIVIWFVILKTNLDNLLDLCCSLYLSKILQNSAQLRHKSCYVKKSHEVKAIEAKESCYFTVIGSRGTLNFMKADPYNLNTLQNSLPLTTTLSKYC